MKRWQKSTLFASALSLLVTGAAWAHHSLAMYDTGRMEVFTGVVTLVNPSSAHLVIHFVPLNEERTKIIRSEDGEPEEWSVEMNPAAASARDGITVNNFPRGSIISIGLHPMRDGGHAGARGKSGLFKCPPNTPPAPGKHCDSVEGSTSHGAGEMPVAGNVSE